MGWFPQQPGGLNRYFQNLYEALPQAHITPRALVVGQPLGPDTPPGVILAAPATASTPARLRRYRAAVTRAVAQRRPDLIASHFALYTGAVPRYRNIPHVVHFHGPWADECFREDRSRLSRLLRSRIERRVYHRANHLVVLSEAFKEVLIQRYGVTPSRVTVVPGGVDTDRFRPTTSRTADRAALGWPEEDPVIFVVRRLVPRMGLSALIESFVTVRQHHPRARLVIAGKGPLLEPLRQQAADQGLSDHVCFTGYLSDDDLPRAHRAADLSVVPTESLEGFGLITLEALASGTPVLVTPVGGLPEVVRGLEPRLILTDGTPATLATTLTEALNRPASLPTAERCVDYVRNGFAWPVIAQRIADVYRRVHAGATA